MVGAGREGRTRQEVPWGDAWALKPLWVGVLF